MKFTLEIEMQGSDIQSFTDIRKAISASLSTYRDAVANGSDPMLEDEGVIVDLSGKRVGQWKIEASKSDECPSCKGYGNITKRDKGGKYIDTCPACGGTGKKPELERQSGNY